MIHVSIHKDIEIPTVARQYAKILQDWKNGGSLPAIFGDEGRWEDHASLCQSYVFKIHIKLPGETPWPGHLPPAARKSNSYLVYTRHWCDQSKYQIISIMSPNAHELARTSFLVVLVGRAENFQNT
ncbi:type II toxin-antitoxin system YafO family toxin [Photorhabdus cinerea]|uniref:Type II toxin-antitoxin system YafO family toxin n=1 Tax=Photorhabdus cinerea TaxID=471575 RepID=A0A7X5QFQ9_9GAMM|nr:type II toxin-antitoxin system YafO family toxin [Photorhabdus cinerea]